MGRKDKFTVDFFLHKCNHGKTIFILESRFGNNGYAVWFKTLELLGASRNHFIDCRNTTDWEFMSAKMQVEPDKLQQIYDLLASLDTIDPDLWSKRIIWSDKFVDGLNEVYARRTNKCMNKSDLLLHLSIKCNRKSSSSVISGSRNTTTVLYCTVLNCTKHIYCLWNSKKIIVHQKLTDETKNKIKTKLKDYSEQQIKTAIDNYSTIINDDQYYFTYKWTLIDFLKKGLDKFLNLQIAKDNYKNKPIDGRGVRRTHAPISDERKKEYAKL